MTRYRPWQWAALAVTAVTAVTVIAVNAQAWTDRGVSNCTTSGRVRPGLGHDHHGWKVGAVQAVGCRAWYHLRSRRPRWNR